MISWKLPEVGEKLVDIGFSNLVKLYYQLFLFQTYFSDEENTWYELHNGRRINTKEKAKVVAAVWRTQFLATL